MGLTKKTTILFADAFYRNLSRVAKHRRTSVGRLIREACEKQYGISSADEAASAAEEIGAMRLPVSNVAAMKRQSVPRGKP